MCIGLEAIPRVRPAGRVAPALLRSVAHQATACPVRAADATVTRQWITSSQTGGTAGGRLNRIIGRGQPQGGPRDGTPTGPARLRTMASPPFPYRLLSRSLRALLPLAAWWSPRLAQGLQGRRESSRAIAAWAAGDQHHAVPVIHLHAASAGELRHAEPVLARLRQLHPDWRWVVTWFSPSAIPFAAEVPAELRGYLPWDTAEEVAAFLDAVRPRATLVSRLDLWPTFAAEADRRRIPVVLIAAQLRAESRRLHPLARRTMRQTYRDVAAAAAVGPEDVDRLAGLGIPRDRITVAGDPRADQVRDLVAAQRPAVRWSALTGECGAGGRLHLAAGRGGTPGGLPAGPGPPSGRPADPGTASANGWAPRGPGGPNGPARAAGPGPVGRGRRRRLAGGSSTRWGRSPRFTGSAGWPTWEVDSARPGCIPCWSPPRGACRCWWDPDGRKAVRPLAWRWRAASSRCRRPGRPSALADQWDRWLQDETARTTAGAAARAVVEAQAGAADRTAAVVESALAGY